MSSLLYPDVGILLGQGAMAHTDFTPFPFSQFFLSSSFSFPFSFCQYFTPFLFF